MKLIGVRPVANLSEVKADPLGTLAVAEREPLLVTSHGKPAFYMLEPKVFEELLEQLDDSDLAIECLNRMLRK